MVFEPGVANSKMPSVCYAGRSCGGRINDSKCFFLVACCSSSLSFYQCNSTNFYMPCLMELCWCGLYFGSADSDCLFCPLSRTVPCRDWVWFGHFFLKRLWTSRSSSTCLQRSESPLLGLGGFPFGEAERYLF